MDPYKKFIGFYTRIQEVFVNYTLVLDAATLFEVKEYGDLTEEQCISFFSSCGMSYDLHVRFLDENHKQLKVYNPLCKDVSQFSKDFSEFKSQRRLKDLRNW